LEEQIKSMQESWQSWEGFKEENHKMVEEAMENSLRHYPKKRLIDYIGLLLKLKPLIDDDD
jgi:hypothetical protein